MLSGAVPSLFSFFAGRRRRKRELMDKEVTNHGC
jgi:hypothetical protein